MSNRFKEDEELEQLRNSLGTLELPSGEGVDKVAESLMTAWSFFQNFDPELTGKRVILLPFFFFVSFVDELPSYSTGLKSTLPPVPFAQLWRRLE